MLIVSINNVYVIWSHDTAPLGLSVRWHPTEIRAVSHDHTVIFGRSNWLEYIYIFFARTLKDNISASTDWIYTNLGLMERSEPAEFRRSFLIKIGLVDVEIFALPSHKFEARKPCLLRDLAWLSDKTLRRDDASDEPDIRKKYTFRSCVYTSLPNTLYQR